MADYKGVLDDLKARRASLAAELKDLDLIINKLESMTYAAIQRVLPIGGSEASLKALSLITAIQQALTDELIDTNEVVARMRRRGFEFKAKRPYASVYSTLFRLAQLPSGPVIQKDGKWARRASD